MSKNTQISELINYISVDGSGNVVLSSGQLVATQNYVSTAITNLVNAAPSTLDTLNELAAALGNDASFSTTITNSLAGKQAALSGTGFVKISGTTITYDNSTYLTTTSASSTYQTLLTNPITGTGTNGQVAYFNGTSSITSNAAFAFTPTSQLLVNNSVTASSAIARGINLTSTLVAAANSDVLVGLDINPTFTNGAFTGVSNYSLRVRGTTNTNFFSSGNIGVNQATDAGFRLDVNGTARVQDNLTILYNKQINLNADPSSYIKSGGTNLLSLGVTGGTDSAIIISSNQITFGSGSGYRLQYATNTGLFALNGSPISGRSFSIIDDGSSILLNLSKRNSNSANYLIAFNNTSGLVEAGIANSGGGFFGTTTIVASAVLQADSTTKGFLPPRMTSAQRTAIASPATGLIVYQTDGVEGLYVYSGGSWKSLTMV